MERTLVGYLVDDTLYSPAGTQIAPPRAVAPPPEPRRRPEPVEMHRDAVTEVADLLARVVRLAQTLHETDQRRVRELVHAASSTLSATTVLPPRDQQLFQRALRDA